MVEIRQFFAGVRTLALGSLFVGTYALSTDHAQAVDVRCGPEVIDEQLDLQDAVTAFVSGGTCTVISLDSNISTNSPLNLFKVDLESPEIIEPVNRSLTIDGGGFTLTGDTGVSGFVIYLGSPDGSNTLTIRNLGMSGFGGSGALSVMSGATVIERSLFTNNTFQSGSPIPGMDDASAGAINAIGGLVVRESQFAGNTGFEGGAIHSAATLVSQFVPTAAALPPVKISGATFTDNDAKEAGGAVFSWQSLAMVNSTVTGNTGKSAGALNITGTASLDFCTIVDNSGSGLGAAVSATSTVDISRSILYANSPGDVSSEVGDALVTSSLVTSPVSVTSTLQNTVLDHRTIVGVDALLSPLGDYGGFTLPGGTKIHTRPPQIGSPVIDKIELIAVGNGDGPTDQRGAGFPRFINGRADMGAVEYWPVLVPDPPTDLTNPLPDFDDFPWSINLERQTHLPDTR
jgi:hypothetical protein